MREVSTALLAGALSATVGDAAESLTGRLRLADPLAVHSDVIVDRFGILAKRNGFPDLPPFDVMLVEAGDDLLPAVRTPVPNDVSPWELIVSPGRVRRGDDAATRRAEIPFALKERNADCLHYGILSFDIDDTGPASMATFSIASETCAYLQFDARGSYRLRHAAIAVPRREEIVAAYRAERAARLLQRPLAALGDDYPGADPDAFGSTDEIDAAAMTAFGFVIDGRHYVGQCATRDGAYPYCDGMPLPSYSLAKSLFAGLALMRAEFRHPGAARVRIGDEVTACDGEGWRDVTVEHALDMATGNYDSAAPLADEDAAVDGEFFLAGDHATKLAAACNAYPRREPPGGRWVYHTSDTYLAGAALTSWLRARAGADFDLYRDLVVEPLWRPLRLSPVTHATRRTADDAGQPFFGWGLNFLRDDVARLGVFLGRDRGLIGGAAVLDPAMFDAAMQRVPGDPGLPADVPGMRYNNGFRALDVAPYLGCAEAAWVPVLSGFGGIIVILLPNDTVYYYFSDGGTHRWMAAAREANRIRPFCAPPGETA